MSKVNDSFEDRLRKYLSGDLPPDQHEEVERELEKLEAYQSLVEEEMDRTAPKKHGERRRSSIASGVNPARVLRRAKWMARFQNAVTAVALVLIVTVVCSAFTSFFYSVGTPSRMETYRDVVRSTIAITLPNVMARSTGLQANPFFTLSMDGDLAKRVGGEELKIGEWEVTFLLGKAGYTNWHWNNANPPGAQFMYPGFDNASSTAGKSRFEPTVDWVRLERLPEGTVAEVYLSLDRLYDTDELLGKLEGRELLPVWFVVDTGIDQDQPEAAIGFPYEPLWHHDDGRLTERSEERQGLWGRQITETREYPRVEAYGSGDIRDKNFIDTLELLRTHEQVADRIARGRPLNLRQRVDYLDANGVKLYGLVVTGPPQELLKRRDEAWVTGMRVGEVALWSWVDR